MVLKVIEGIFEIIHCLSLVQTLTSNAFKYLRYLSFNQVQHKINKAQGGAFPCNTIWIHF